jgi:hypothetical protein
MDQKSGSEDVKNSANHCDETIELIPAKKESNNETHSM